MHYSGVALVVHGGAALILLTAALVKWVSPDAFRTVLDGNPFTASASTFWSRTVPASEFLLGLLLLLSLERLAVVSVVSAGLFVVLALVGWFSNSEECGCGPLVPRTRVRRAAFNLSLSVSLLVSAALPAAPWEGRVLAGALVFVAVLTFRLVGYYREDVQAVRRVIEEATA